MNDLPVRILIAEDHTLFAEAVGQLFKKLPQYLLVGVCQNAHETLWMLQKHEVDILLLDLNIPQQRMETPQMGGINILDYLRHDSICKAQIIIISSFNDFQLTTTALKKGASGYLLKNTTSNELLKAIEEVRAGRIYLQKEVANQISIKGETDEEEALIGLLTPREKQVAKLVSHGFTSTQIAEKLNLTNHTVNEYKDKAQRKLGAKNAADMVRILYQNRLLDS